MARPKSTTAPKYRLHKPSGNAAVTIHGTAYYLGTHGTAESKRKYKRLISDLWATDGEHKPSEPNPNQVVTVSFLCVEFAKYAKKRYQKNGMQTNEWFIVQNILKDIRGTYGDLPATEFGPIRFKNYRQSLVGKGLARHTVKRYANHVVQMFRYANENELIPVNLYQRLKAVGPVEMPAKPRKKVKPVSLKIVEATKAELTQVVSDMVELQLLTGMRPGEVCNLRPCDINRESEIWVYEPPIHKTQRFGKERPILIGPKAQMVLNRYLLREPQAYCFTPSEAYEQHYEQRREARKTPLNCGNGPKPRKQKSFKPKYDANSYRRAVHRAAIRAYPVPEGAHVKEWESLYKWSPNQLRHSAATHARKEYDLETAQVLLGHSSKSTTERFYAEQDLTGAIEYAKNFG